MVISSTLLFLFPILWHPVSGQAGPSLPKFKAATPIRAENGLCLAAGDASQNGTLILDICNGLPAQTWDIVERQQVVGPDLVGFVFSGVRSIAFPEKINERNQ